MGAFSSTKTIPISVQDLAPIANDLVLHFQRQGYETTSLPRLSGGWDVSITKGGIFKSVIGTKTALKIEIVNGHNETNVRASVGIFGLHAIPSAISLYLLFWPMLATQIFGLVRQSHLDDEAIACVEESLKIRAKQNTSSDLPSRQQGFCVECGAAVRMDATFCDKCGAKLPLSSQSEKGAS